MSTATTTSAPRSTLASMVRRGSDSRRGLRLVVYGPEGVGKTSFAARAPAPVFLGPEDGMPADLLDTPHLPSPGSWTELLSQVRLLATEEHAFKTVVIDTLDWIEPVLWDHVCAGAKVKSIEDVGGGFGKGYVAAVEGWRVLLSELERCGEHGMHVIMLAHAQLKAFKNPEGTDYDRYSLKINEKAAGKIKEWSDAVLFARYEDFVDVARRGAAKGKASGGARVMHTSRRPAFDAKNRHNLPETIALDWREFERHAIPSTADAASACAALRAEIASLCAEYGKGETTKGVTEAIQKAGENAGRLAQIKNLIAAKIAEKIAAESNTNETQE